MREVCAWLPSSAKMDVTDDAQYGKGEKVKQGGRDVNQGGREVNQGGREANQGGREVNRGGREVGMQWR